MLSFVYNVIFVFLAAPCSAMTYHHDSRRIFVGQDNGSVMVGTFQDACIMSTSLCSYLLGSLNKVSNKCLIGIKIFEFSIGVRPKN